MFSVLLGHITNLHALEEQKTVQELCALAENHEAQKKPYEAISLYKKALELDTHNANIPFQIGKIYYYLGAYTEGVPFLQQTARMAPRSFDAQNTLAIVAHSAGMIECAKNALENALALRPTDATVNRKLLEYYLSHQDCATVKKRWPITDLPWTDANLHHKKVVLDLGEGLGYGDRLHFVSYASILKQAGATVIVRTVPELIPLFSLCPALDTVISTKQEMPTHDFRFSYDLYALTIKSLKHSFIPTPFLQADPTLVDTWSKKLSSDTNFKIGLLWESSRVTEEYFPHKNRLSHRSIPLAQLAPLASVPGVSFYSFQKMHGVKENQIPSHFVVTEFDADFDVSHGRFMDTAAVMKNLDLVITVDTAIAHLAGALGIHTWMLLPVNADWRWFSGSFCPWYPTVKLFRQTTQGNWSPVVTSITQELTQIIAQKNKKNSPADTQAQFQALITQAQTYGEKQQYDQEIQCYRRALELMPEKKDLLPSLAYAQYKKNDLESCYLSYKKAAEAFPSSAELHFNAGFLARHIGKFNEAVPLLQRAIELDPSHRRAREHLGYTYLTLARLPEGWTQFRYLDRQNPSIDNAHRLYDINPQGKTIMVKDIGGYGDLFQFIRHAQDLKKRGAKIIFYARPEVIPLLSGCSFFDAIVSQKDPVPAFDYYTNIAKMREDLDVSMETVSHDIPYIYPDPKLVKKWSAILAHDHQYKVGISWQAQSYIDSATKKKIVCTRSLPIDLVKKLAQELPFISFYCLQKNADLSELMQCSNFHVFDESFDTTSGRFMDTAAVIKNLDLVISIDTSIAHLAGALGMPVWTLLRKFPDWRWSIDREDSPWYPTMRLFRQQKDGEWEFVVQKVIRELPSYLIKHTTDCSH
jgi:tetratricopeptide (TPR) repeat protein